MNLCAVGFAHNRIRGYDRKTSSGSSRSSSPSSSHRRSRPESPVDKKVVHPSPWRTSCVITRVVAVTVLALGLSLNLTPAHAEPPAETTCQFERRDPERHNSRPRRERVVTVDLAVTATGCGPDTSAVVEFAELFQGDVHSTTDDPTRWAGTVDIDIDIDYLYNKDAKGDGLFFLVVHGSTRIAAAWRSGRGSPRRRPRPP